MKRFLCALIAAFFLFPVVCDAAVARAQVPSPTPTPIVLEGAAVPVAGAVNVVVPKGKQLVVMTDESINSYSAHVGERIRYEVAQDFIVDGYLIAKKGDVAEGEVEEGQKGDAGGPYGIGYHAANLRVSVTKVYTFCGSTIELYFDRSEYRRRQGIFGSHADVDVIKGQKYVPSIDHPQTTCAVKTTAQPEPIPTDALETDKG